MSRDSVAHIWNGILVEARSSDYPSEIIEHLQKPTAVLNDEWYGANIDEFYVKTQKWMRQSDVHGFNSLFGSRFESYGNIQETRFIDDIMYECDVPVSGAVDNTREEAVNEIIKYMIDNGMIEEDAIDSVRLDKHLPRGVLGRTAPDEDGDYGVVYRPEIFNTSYKSVSNPYERENIKFWQARVIKHEDDHLKRLESSDSYRVARNLDNLDYNEATFKGLLEGGAELKTMKAFINAGDIASARRIHEESPYHDQLLIAERIEKEFRYSDTERVYKGFEGFYEALAKGLIDRKTADKFLGGIALKSDFMPAYKNSGTCGKCYGGGGKGCGSSGYAS